MQVRFWGVRGTIPTPGRNTLRYGGNTSCIDIQTSDGQEIIIDAGTGIRILGKRLGGEYPLRVKSHIFLSHTHWDHIQGLPFFDPLSSRRNSFIIIGQLRIHNRLEEVLARQFLEPYLPFAYRSLPATLSFKEVNPGDTFTLGENVKVTVDALNHPGGCIGFRVEDNGAVFAYCSDTTHERDRYEPGVLRLSQDADLMIHDAHFPDLKTTLAFNDWGHSCWEQAVGVAAQANVKALGLFHYGPDLTDTALDEILGQARQQFPNTFLTREGLTCQLPMRDGLPQ